MVKFYCGRIKTKIVCFFLVFQSLLQDHGHTVTVTMISKERDNK